MSLSRDPSLRTLNDCGCCIGIGIHSPLADDNRPGLSQIAYRVGTHARFKQTMLARLSSSELWRRFRADDAPGLPWPLAGLQTRDDDDFSIALLDAWAALADVLTFYQERIANEAFLRTATERVSLLQLARLIGYELRPGVAASTALAFILEDAQGAPGLASIPLGLKVQSIPGQEELPQTFETSVAFDARAEWNVLRPRMRVPWRPALGDTSLYLDGTTTSLKPGDRLVFVGAAKVTTAASTAWDVRRVLTVTPRPELKGTRVSWDGGLGATSPRRDPSNDAQVYVFRQRAGIFGHNAADWRGLPDAAKASYLGLDDPAKLTPSQKQEWQDFVILAPDHSKPISTPVSIDDIIINVQPRLSATGPGATLSASASAPGGAQAFIGGGGKFPKEIILTPSVSSRRPRYEPLANTIDLDNVYSQVTPGSWIVLATAARQELFQVTAVAETSRADYLLSAKVSRLTLRGDASHLALFLSEVREVTVYVQSELLPAAEQPIEDPVTGTKVPVTGAEIALDRIVDGLTVGRDLVVVGKSASDGSALSQKVSLLRTEVDGPVTTLMLSAGLVGSYDRGSMSIYGNVVPATHGETVGEVLGGGDGRQAFQRFQLRQSPLTYVAATVPSGGESTLQVRVNDVLWHEVPFLYGRRPDEHAYVTRRGDDGSTTVQFGDGQTGARPPTGQENITAVYRKGVGLVGQVRAGQLSLLTQRPLGVREVLNPQAADGAEDPELPDDARRNAPLAVLTMDRIVSLQDYEDFARAFSGIGKALATWTWDGERRAVFVTVAGPNGTLVPRGSDLHTSLVTAMRAGSDPFVPLRVETFQPATFQIGGTVYVDPDYLPDSVLAAVETALRAQFAFEARAFGQPVELSEVVAAIQAVTGVSAVVLTALNRTGQTAGLPPPPGQRLTAAAPQAGGLSTVLGAELLTLDPGPLGLTTVLGPPIDPSAESGTGVSP